MIAVGKDDSKFYGDFPDVAAAIEGAPELLDLAPGEIFYTGTIVDADASQWAPDSDLIIDYLKDRADEACGEMAMDWLDNLMPEAKAELDDEILEMVTKWLQKHESGRPSTPSRMSPSMKFRGLVHEEGFRPRVREAD